MKKSIGKIAIIGLGYVGLPLAVGFSKKYQVIGFDLNSKRIIQKRLPKQNSHLYQIFFLQQKSQT